MPSAPFILTMALFSGKKSEKEERSLYASESFRAKIERNDRQGHYDHELTVSEYEKILHIASQDGVIDRQEKALLQTLQQMIESGEVRRVPDRK